MAAPSTYSGITIVLDIIHLELNAMQSMVKSNVVLNESYVVYNIGFGIAGVNHKIRLRDRCSKCCHEYT